MGLILVSSFKFYIFLSNFTKFLILLFRFFNEFENKIILISGEIWKELGFKSSSTDEDGETRAESDAGASTSGAHKLRALLPS